MAKNFVAGRQPLDPPIPPNADQPPPADAVQAPAPTVREAELLAQNTELAARLQRLEILLGASTPDRQAEEKRLAELRAVAELPAAVRTQMAADKHFPARDTDRVYKVVLPEMPMVVLAAASPEEAKGRYQKLCGIRETSHEYTCTEVPAAAAA
jgi:hypothetical protein